MYIQHINVSILGYICVYAHIHLHSGVYIHLHIVAHSTLSGTVSLTLFTLNGTNQSASMPEFHVCSFETFYTHMYTYIYTHVYIYKCMYKYIHKLANWFVNR